MQRVPRNKYPYDEFSQRRFVRLDNLKLRNVRGFSDVPMSEFVCIGRSDFGSRWVDDPDIRTRVKQARQNHICLASI